MKTKIIILFICTLFINVIHAQDSIQIQLQNMQTEINSLKNESKSHFMVRGFTQFGLEASKDNVNFAMTSFNPVLLWRQGDRFIFESELEMEYMGNDFNISLGYANASYIVSKGLIVRVGKFLIPFGTFNEKYHPSWVNKFATNPLGLGHDGISPGGDIGIELRGAFNIGNSKMNYSVYAVNGPRIQDGIDEPEEAGMLIFENSTDNNKNKAIGGRIGFLPLSNSSLEVGVSGYYAKPGDELSPFENDSMNEDLNYKDVTAMLTAFDLSYVKAISTIKGIIDIKGQYNISNISDAMYYNPENTSQYTFDNSSSAYYAQLAYRPALSENNVIKNLEAVGRYSNFETPEGSLSHSINSQVDIGLNYWFTWRTVLKISFQSTKTETEEEEMNGSMQPEMTGHQSSTGEMFLIHLAIGL